MEYIDNYCKFYWLVTPYFDKHFNCCAVRLLLWPLVIHYYTDNFYSSNSLNRMNLFICVPILLDQIIKETIESIIDTLHSNKIT